MPPPPLPAALVDRRANGKPDREGRDRPGASVATRGNDPH
jgi:hypothetical protein